MEDIKLWIEESGCTNPHVISSTNVLSCSETGRVMAVFYNDFDLDRIIKELKNDKKEIECLKKMIDHGISWADLEDDTKPF